MVSTINYPKLKHTERQYRNALSLHEHAKLFGNDWRLIRKIASEEVECPKKTIRHAIGNIIQDAIVRPCEHEDLSKEGKK